MPFKSLDSLTPTTVRSHWALTFKAGRSVVDEALYKLEHIANCFVAVGEEGSQTGLLHWHIYFYKKGGLRARTVMKLFPEVDYFDGVKSRSSYFNYLSKNVVSGALVLGSELLVKELKEKAALTPAKEALTERLRRLVDEGFSLDSILESDQAFARQTSFVQAVVRLAALRKYGPGNSRDDLKVFFVQTDNPDAVVGKLLKAFGGKCYLVDDGPFPWANFENQPVALFTPPAPGKLRPTDQLQWIVKTPVPLPSYLGGR